MRTSRVLFLVAILLPLSGLFVDARAADPNEKCFECHEEKIGTLFKKSSHVKLKTCTKCHTDVVYNDEGDHPEKLKKVNCSSCHKKAGELFINSLHGQALLKKDKFAPTCISCHGKHDILTSKDPNSHTYPLNVPGLCSTCHTEGSKMTKVHHLSKKNVVKKYSMSIHGKGVFRRGLVVSAVCSSCHGSHDIRRHTDPKSSIHKDRLAKTCINCHARIQQVHKQIIRGELWLKKPGNVPSCASCHPPHQVRRVTYQQDIPDQTCIKCHTDPKTTIERNGKIIKLLIDLPKFRKSKHGKTPCIKCHTEARGNKRPPCKKIPKVQCGNCHNKQLEDFKVSFHGQLNKKNDPNAPTCVTCHDSHNVMGKKDPKSPIYRRNIATLCASCHREGEKAAVLRLKKPGIHHLIKQFEQSIHGKGLKAGLVVSATCTDCHTSHRELPKKNPESTVHPKNITRTCSKCHEGIADTLQASVHGQNLVKKGKRSPTCADCHQSHTIQRVSVDRFRQTIFNQCGECHKEITKTYFDTLHGKVSKLGHVVAAKCHDCHGSHDILPPTNPKSKLSRGNIIQTCKTCHANSNRKFTGYLTHATHHNKDKYPILYYTFWSMTILLLSTLGFFGIHTLLWFPRSIHEWIKRRKEHKEKYDENTVYYRRFLPIQSAMHIMVIISFLGLAATGMTLRFPDFAFFRAMSEFVGGFKVTGFVHRLCAVLTFGYFALHLGHVFVLWRTKKMKLKAIFSGGRSMVPNKRDFIEFGQTIKWFLGMGPKPKYGRFTYWEKFDYLAVFWGVAMIGGTGLILWFPAIFTYVLPGWAINVAMVIHSDEALLATGFIFTVHFFNTHFRPDRLPMDPVIFTGRVPLEEMKEERPREYQMLVDEGKLEERLTGPPPRWLVIMSYTFGLSCLAIGISMIVAIVWAMLFQYK